MTLAALQAQLTLPSPLERLHHQLFDAYEVKVYAKRDDLIHPYISGNKWRKLYGFLQAYIQSDYDSILTFGGAYSNHIYATAPACAALDIPLHLIIRGEEVDLTNPTLSSVIKHSANVHRVSRAEYRLKHNGQTAQQLITPKTMIVPEGGNGSLSDVGVGVLANEIQDAITPDVIILGSGTGASASGLLKHLSPTIALVVCNAVRDTSVNAALHQVDTHKRLTIIPERWGGFAKTKPELRNFVSEWNQHNTMQIEPVYTGKVLYELFELVKQRYFAKGSKIVFVHTGGLR